MTVSPNDILKFWTESGPEKWWSKDDRFDAEIRQHFGDTLKSAERGELDDWQTSPDGTLALLLVLDQFSRNLNRNSALAYANDPKALSIAEEAINRGDDKKMREKIRIFAYLPFMHSENLQHQRRCLDLMQDTGLEPNIEAAKEHLDIIERFGRFPHRNKVLGRVSTPQEIAFLENGGFSG